MHRSFWTHGGALLAVGCALIPFSPAHAEDDTIAPAGLITVPAKNSAVKSLPAIRGTATDNVGVTKAIAYLRRAIDSKSWNGTAWVGELSPLPMAVTPIGGTAVQMGRTATLPLPGTSLDTQLTEGNYYTFAYVYDAAGHRSVTPGNNFTVDRTAPPSPAVTVPLPGSFLNKLTSIRIAAADNEGGSGVDRVTYVLRRQIDGQYWVDGTWSPTATYVNAIRSTVGVWSQAGLLPSGDQLANGNYAIIAYSYDRAGTRCLEPGKSIFTIDKVAPTVAFDSPIPNSMVKSLTILRGPVSDNSKVVSRATVSLRRVSDNFYWSGTDWGATLVNLKADVVENTFRYTSLPSGEKLKDGSYAALAYAYDAAGNRSLEPARCSFRLDTVAPAVFVTQPANGAIVTSLPKVVGSATDLGTGVARVFVALSRAKTGGGVEVWAKRSGVFGWGETSGDLPLAVLTNPNGTSTAWTASSNLPSGTSLPPGQYLVSGVADDLAGNRFISQPNTFQVGAATADSVVVSAPANGATITALTAIEGHAVDAQNVVKVAIALTRTIDGNITQVWGIRNGVLGWGSTEGLTLPLATLAAANSTETNFRLGSNLPSGTNLPPGAYAVAAQSFDGNAAVLVSSVNSFTVAAPTFAYAGKYNVTFVPASGVANPIESGGFVLTVDNEKHATATFTVNSLKGIDGKGYYKLDGVAGAIGLFSLKKTSTGDTFAGSYSGTAHDNNTEASQDSTLTMTVGTEGATTLHVVYADSSTADFTGTTNLTTGVFSLSGHHPENTTLIFTGQLKRHTGVVTLAGTVGTTGIVAATLTNDANLNGDTFSGDLDADGTGPLRGHGVIADTGTNDSGPGDGGVIVNWTSQRQ